MTRGRIALTLLLSVLLAALGCTFGGVARSATERIELGITGTATQSVVPSSRPEVDVRGSMTITNTGDVTADARLAFIIATSVVGLTRIASVVPSRGTCRLDTEASALCFFGSLPVGESATVEFAFNNRVGTEIEIEGLPFAAFGESASQGFRGVFLHLDAPPKPAAPPVEAGGKVLIPIGGSTSSGAPRIPTPPAPPPGTLLLSFEGLRSQPNRHVGDEIVAGGSLSIPQFGSYTGSVDIVMRLPAGATIRHIQPFSTKPGECTIAELTISCRLDMTSNPGYAQFVRFTMDAPGTYEVTYTYGKQQATYPFTVLPALPAPFVPTLASSPLSLLIGKSARPATTARLVFTRLSPPACAFTGPGAAGTTCSAVVRVSATKAITVTAARVVATTGKTAARWRILLDAKGRLVSWSKVT